PIAPSQSPDATTLQTSSHVYSVTMPHLHFPCAPGAVSGGAAFADPCPVARSFCSASRSAASLALKRAAAALISSGVNGCVPDGAASRCVDPAPAAGSVAVDRCRGDPPASVAAPCVLREAEARLSAL